MPSICQSCGNDKLQLDLYCPECKFVSPSAHDRLADAFIENLHKRGNRAYTEKRNERAASAFKLIIKLRPDNAEAVDFLKKIETEQYSLEYLLSEARLALQNRRLEEAVEKAAAVCRVHPGHPEAEEILKQSREEMEQVASLEAMAAEHLGQGEYGTAVEVLEEILQHLPESEKHRTQLNITKKRLTRHDRELRNVKKLIAAGNPDAAFPILEKLSIEAPSDSEVQTLMDRASRKQDRVFKLLPEAREAIKASEYAKAQKLLAQVLATDKTHEEAKELWERAKAQKRRAIRKWSLIGAGAVAALLIFVFLLVSFSQRSSNSFLLKQAREAVSRGEYRDALELYSRIGTAGVDAKAVERERRTIEIDALMESAEEHLAREAWSKAEQALSEAEQKGARTDRINPYRILARAFRDKFTAKTALDEGRWFEALEIHRKILSTEDQKVAGWKALIEHINMERLRAKRAWLDEAGKKLNNGKLEEAAESIGQGREFFPHSAEADALAGRCLTLMSEKLDHLVSEKKWQPAFKEAEKLKRLFPNDKRAASIANCVQFDRQMAKIQERIAVAEWEEVETRLAMLEASNPPKERQAELGEVKKTVADKIEAVRRSRFERLCAEADKCFNARQWDEAAKAYAKALDLIEDPKVERKLAQARGQAKAPPGLIYIPGGKFTMGSNTGGFKNEYPAHTVKLRPFYIGLTEVTNREYLEFIEAKGLPEPEIWKDPNFKQPDQPIVCVSLEEAKACAEWKGMRLPTEAEWEYAARGPDALTYPWGNSFDAKRCRCYYSGEKCPAIAGSYPNGKSPWGCLDMAGNVFEWTTTRFDMYPGAPATDDRAGKNLYIVKGGAYSSDSTTLRAAYRDRACAPAEKRKSLGFRLAKDVKLVEEE